MKAAAMSPQMALSPGGETTTLMIFTEGTRECLTLSPECISKSITSNTHGMVFEGRWAIREDSVFDVVEDDGVTVLSLEDESLPELEIALPVVMNGQGKPDRKR